MMRSWKRKFDWSFRVISFLLMKTNSNWFLTLSERSDELFRRRQCTCMHGGENLKALLLSTSQLCLSHQFSWFSVRINPIFSNQKQYKIFIYSFIKKLEIQGESHRGFSTTVTALKQFKMLPSSSLQRSVKSVLANTLKSEYNTFQLATKCDICKGP